jgi:hypothetical protein
MEPEVKKVNLGRADPKAIREKQGRKVIRVIPVLKGCKVRPVLWDHVVSKGLRVSKAIRASEALPDYRGPKVTKGMWDP